jgi:hypothetical protein
MPAFKLPHQGTVLHTETDAATGAVATAWKDVVFDSKQQTCDVVGVSVRWKTGTLTKEIGGATIVDQEYATESSTMEYTVFNVAKLRAWCAATIARHTALAMT